jgi:hypothetical protein
MILQPEEEGKSGLHETSPKGDGFLRGKLSTFLGILRSFHSIFDRRFFVSLKYKADKSPKQENASGHHQPCG